MLPTDVQILAVTTSWFEAALIIFFVVFVLIVLRAAFARPRAYHHAARIPLDDQGILTPRDRVSEPAGAGIEEGGRS